MSIIEYIQIAGKRQDIIEAKGHIIYDSWFPVVDGFSWRHEPRQTLCALSVLYVVRLLTKAKPMQYLVCLTLRFNHKGVEW